MYFYLNLTEHDGDNELHAESCPWLKQVVNKKFLGYFTNCQEAIKEAKKLGYTKADGCIHCCLACHKK